MPEYTVRDPQSGRTIVVRGDSLPTEAELGQMFREVNGRTVAPRTLSELNAARTQRRVRGPDGVLHLFPADATDAEIREALDSVSGWQPVESRWEPVKEARRPRILSEAEFEAAKQKAIASLPPGLDESSFNARIGSAMAQARAEAENTPPTPQGSATSRFLGGAARNLNPI